MNRAAGTLPPAALSFSQPQQDGMTTRTEILRRLRAAAPQELLALVAELEAPDLLILQALAGIDDEAEAPPCPCGHDSCGCAVARRYEGRPPKAAKTWYFSGEICGALLARLDPDEFGAHLPQAPALVHQCADLEAIGSPVTREDL